MMPSRKPSLPIAAALAAFALASCILTREPLPGEGPSTETGNPNLSGFVRNEAGAAVPSRVKLFRLPPEPGPDARDTLPPPAPVLVDSVSAADGRYAFDSLPPATYALEARGAAGPLRFALARDLAIAGPGDTLIRDLALGAPGRIAGIATRGPNLRPAGVLADAGILVRLIGADRAAATDSAGRYSLEDVPAGTYRMAFASADGHYLTRYVEGIQVPAGGGAEPAPVELEWSRYGEPPAVAGLAVAVDSSAGAVLVSWRAVRLSGGAPALYAVYRGGVEIHRGPDTAFADSLAGVAPGTSLSYAVRALNPLGQAGPAAPAAPVAAPGPVGPPPGEGTLQGAFLEGNSPVSGARVALYSVPAAPGSPDSLPLGAVLLDSATTGTDGRYRFAGLGEGRYTVVARTPAGAGMALAAGLSPRKDGARADTLRAAPGGSVEGAASRDSLWITSPFKGEENIRVSLAGTPFSGATEFGSPPQGGPFALRQVPAGTYTLVIYATPEGYFLPDSIPVTVAAGQATRLPAVVKARYNPAAPPPRIASLKVEGTDRNRVRLAWDPVGRYPFLQGYRVIRMSPSLIPLDSSAVLPSAAYADDVSGVAPGTRLSYAVRVVGPGGREGVNGGNSLGLPVEVTVPAN